MTLPTILLLQAVAGSNPSQVVTDAAAAVRAGRDSALVATWRRSRPNDPLAILGLATVARLRGRFPEADSLFTSLLANPDHRLTLEAHLGLGHSAAYRLPHAEVARRYLAAVPPAIAVSDSVSWAEALAAASIVMVRGSPTSEAFAVLDSAERIAPRRAAATLARIHCARAQGMLMTNHPAVATEARQGIALAKAAGDGAREADCWIMIAWREANSGTQAAALAAADSAEAAALRGGDERVLAQAHWWRGHLNLEEYRHGIARRDLVRSVEEGTRSGNRFIVAWANYRLASLTWHFSDLGAARRHLESARADFDWMGDLWGMSASRWTAGAILLDAGDLTAAEAAFREAIAWADRANIPLEVFSATYGLARLAARRGDPASALAHFAAAESTARAHGLTSYLPQLTYERASLALRQGNLTQARRLLARYLATEGEGGLARYAAQSRLAETALQAGDLATAEREAIAAADQLDHHRSILDDEELHALAFQAHRGYDDPDLGFSALIAGLATGRRVPAAFHLAERRRARQLADRLLRAEAVSTSWRSPAPITATDLARRLPNDRSALILLVAGRDRTPTTAFVTSRQGTDAVLLPPADSVSGDVAALVDLLEAGHDPAALARSLGRRLFEPIAAKLDPAVEHLAIVPDGVFHRLPFDALTLADGRPVLDRFAIAVAPSATFAADRWSDSSVVRGRVLALGAPDFTPPDVESPGPIERQFRDGFEAAGGLPALPSAAAEAKQAAGFAFGSFVLTGGGASEAALKAMPLELFAVIHFATHGLVDDHRVERTALALAPGGGEDGFLSAAELGSLRPRGALVVLSACRTGRGWVVEGEGVQGLTGPLLAAGARAVVATQWRVPDRDIGPLVTALYRGLGAGLPVADALRKAKQTAISAGVPQSVWASFTVIGDGRLSVAFDPPPASSTRYRPTLILATIAAAALLLYLGRRAARGAGTPPPSER